MQYQVAKRDFKQKIEIINKAKELADKWWVDTLGLNNDDIIGSMRRQKIDMSFEDIMAKFKKDSHFVVVHRNHANENYLEVGFSTSTMPVYFLWIIVNAKHLEEFVKEFDLKQWG